MLVTNQNGIHKEIIHEASVILFLFTQLTSFAVWMKTLISFLLWKAFWAPADLSCAVSSSSSSSYQSDTCIRGHNLYFQDLFFM
jgi:hypothetical protein